MSHDIRLAGPWQYSADGTNWQKCVLPFGTEAYARTDADVFSLRRKFHRPTGLEESSGVLLLITANHPIAQILVGEQQVDCESTPDNDQDAPISEFDVSGVLDEFNVLTVCIDGASAVQLEDVRLRILEEQ